MADDEIAQVKGGVQLLPMTAGTIVCAYNLPGNLQGLKLSREVYPKIFLFEIKNWNDAAIAKDNPEIKLPDLPVTVVRRADSSGTTHVFTKHLSAVSAASAKGPGFGTTVSWPGSDKIVAAPKNDGVTATIKQTPGAIGYIEYGYAKPVKVNMAMIENKACRSFSKPSLSFWLRFLVSFTAWEGLWVKPWHWRCWWATRTRSACPFFLNRSIVN
jgi:phosphate transport system substrate-binding protein